MREEIVYLDSSSIVKRYVKEKDSNFIESLYMKAYSGDVKLSFNIWNIGEVIGAFNNAKIQKRLEEKEYTLSKKRFLLECKRLVKLGMLVLVPLKTKLVYECWGLIERYSIYEADAIQIVSARNVDAKEFLTGDKFLHKIALEEKLNSVFVG
ncbi:MAG: type II toxin-antitoxin system VapC family toxin [Nitrososphaeria archaeon]